MLAALLLAFTQPATVDAAFAPPSGSYGWIEQLAGSCFAMEAESGIPLRSTECFAVRDGRFTITSTWSHPRFSTREECVLQSARDGVLRFGCTRQGGTGQAMVGRYRDGAFVTRRPSRSAAISWREYVETWWRMEGEDQLSISVILPEPNRVPASELLPPPRLLMRVRP